MNGNERHPALAGPGIMLLSAAIFGYFGFYVGPTSYNALGQFILFFAMLQWTLKATTIGFVIAAVLTFAAPIAGNLIFSLVGVISALFFVAIAVLDVMDQQNAAAAPPVLLILFAAWNGYGSWSGLKMVLTLREAAARRETMEPPAGMR